MASKQPTVDNEGFEALYNRLEEAVSKLEEGGLTLDQSLALYEDGMQLARRCQDLLQQAELRISRLQESFTNGLSAIREEAAEYLSETEPEAVPDELTLE